MAVVSSNACPRKNKTTRGWNQGLSWPERRHVAHVAVLHPVPDILSSLGFLQVEVSLHCVSNNVHKLWYYVQEFPKQEILASRIE